MSNDVSYLSSTFLLFSDNKYYSCCILQKTMESQSPGEKLRYCHRLLLLPFLIRRHQGAKDTISEDRSRKLPKATSTRFQKKSQSLFYHTVTFKKGQLMDKMFDILKTTEQKAQSFLHKVLQKYQETNECKYNSS